MSEALQDTADAKPAGRLAALRAALAELGLAGFVVAHADEHQSEVLPASAERLAWLTGFTGSAGTAIVLGKSAAIFVDGRYTLQVRAEVDTQVFAPQHVSDTPPAKWLASRLNKGDRVGYDPWLMTVAEVRRFTEACGGTHAEFVAVAENPIDRLWRDRPAPPLGPVSLHPLEFAGEAAAAKIAHLQGALAESHADAAVLTEASSIAWAFNIRGRDVAHNPAPLAFAILPARGRPQLFIDGRKLAGTVRDALAELAVLREPAELGGRLAALGAGKARVLIDPQSTAEAIAAIVREAGGAIVEGSDPVALPKAKKNPTELAGAAQAHVRDGAAMVRFLAWLDEAAPTGTLDEMAAAEKLTAVRADTAVRDGSQLIEASFEAISAAGANGAIVHYRARPATARKLAPGSLYLIDSGAQYRDGTTDVTRTVAIGSPSAEMRDRFTRVLKGHIAIATARFPVGTTGAQLDTLARLSLWQAGLDYDHGTGHGVGAFLSVHEGPARISKHGTVPLETGMILSNEPGYYKQGAYGIRIENLMVVSAPLAVAGGEHDLQGFTTLTLAPIDRRLVEKSLMTAEEIAWLDAYHAGLPAALARLLDEGERAWLAAATRPLAAGAV